MVNVRFTIPRIVVVGQFLAVVALALLIIIVGIILFANITIMEKIFFSLAISCVYGLVIGYCIVLSSKYAFLLRIEEGKIVLRNNSRKFGYELSKVRIFKMMDNTGKAMLIFLPVFKDKPRSGLGKLFTYLFALKGNLNMVELKIVEAELEKQQGSIEQW